MSLTNYQQTLRSIDQLRERGYKVKVAHLRKPPSINIPPAIRDAFLMMQPEYEKILNGMEKGEFFNTRQLRALGLSPKHFGGVTRVRIISLTGDEWTGEAWPNEKMGDRFNKKIGLQIAFGLAYKSMVEEAIGNEIVKETSIH